MYPRSDAFAHAPSIKTTRCKNYWPVEQYEYKLLPARWTSLSNAQIYESRTRMKRLPIKRISSEIPISRSDLAESSGLSLHHTSRFSTAFGSKRSQVVLPGEAAAASKGFSGAEIEQAIAAGLYTAFSAKKQLSADILLAEIHGTQPLSVTRAEDIQGVCEWAKSRAVAAD